MFELHFSQSMKGSSLDQPAEKKRKVVVQAGLGAFGFTRAGKDGADLTVATSARRKANIDL